MVVVVRGSRSICRLVLLWLQYHYLLLLVAPVSVACGSSVSFVLVCGQLAQPVVVAPVAPVSVVVACPVAPVLSPVVVRGSSICRLWLRQWLQSPVLSVVHGSSTIGFVVLSCGSSLTARPVSVVVTHHGSSICCLIPVSPVSVVRGSSISCRSWLRYLLSFMAPVSPVVRGSGSSSICRSWLQSICRLWLRYLLWLSFVAPVAVVLSCGSSICCGCLHQYHYLLLVAPVAPVSVACDSCCSCVFNRQSSSVLAIFLPNRLLLLYLSKYRQITTTEW